MLVNKSKKFLWTSFKPVILKKIWLQTSLLFLLLLIFLDVYLDTIIYILKGWTSYNGGHGFIIFLISVYLIWIKRNDLKTAAITPQFFLGSLILFISSILFIAGDFSNILLIKQLSLIVTMIGIISLLFGASYFKILFLPVGYLIFMFPLFEEVLGTFSHFFQITGAFIAANLLKLTNMPVFHHREFIELPHISLEVAKLCSGINHITAIVSLSIPLSYITQKTKLAMVMLVAITFILGVFSNGLRVALIGIWTLYADSSSIHGPFSLLYTSTVFTIIFIFIGLYSAVTGKEHIKNTIKETRAETNVISTQKRKIKYLPILIAITILLATEVYSSRFEPIPVYLKNNLNDIPITISKWKGESVENLNERYENGNPDMELKRIYRDDDGNKINLYIAYYTKQEQDKEIVNYIYDWLHDRALITMVQDEKGSDVNQVNKGRYYRKGEWRGVYFWYNINGKTVLSRYMAKMITMINAFMLKKTNGMIIIVSYNNRLIETDGFQEDINQFVGEICHSLNNIKMAI